MRSLAVVACIALALVGATASAQELNLAHASTARPSIVAVRSGMDHAFVGEIGYRRVLGLGNRTLFVGGDVTLPWARPDLRDHRVRATVGLPLGTRHWRLAGWLSPTLRGTDNAASRMVGVGLDARLAGGYYAPRWFVAGEVGLDWTAATRIAISDAYRANYPGARDGWYRLTGGTAYAGLQAGLSFGTFEVVARAGHPRTPSLAPQSVPFYVTGGVNVSLPR